MLNGEDENPTIDRGPFTDPVVRCDSCVKIIRGDSLRSLGACPNCGNKRVRNLTIFNLEEYEQIKAWGYKDFLEEFEVVVDE